MVRIVIRAEGPQGSGKSTALMAISDALHEKGYRMSNSVEDEHAVIARAPNPLPAPALTEDAIVAALKADPGMAGRVMVDLAVTVNGMQRDAISVGAYEAVSTTERRVGLQSLAVALAAASYRG